MLYRVLRRTIERGDNLSDMQGKLDVFFAASRITQAEYTELTTLLS